jgi:predicted ATPase/signal transduction histidine kinase/tRNA A-37 threonylcarbamoyl transferase component Bud32
VLGERLHVGQRTTVYRAVRATDGQTVVLKVLDARHSRPQDAERLRNEYELGVMLKGLAVVEPLALSSFQGLPALELENFQDGALARLVGRPMPLDAFLHLAARVASIVADIHERGLIHKDLKPENILVNAETGEVKIGDFCIASRIPREQTTARPVRLIEGSLPYVSPEQTGRMNRSIDSRSDLYSLGVTFYQLVTGRLPFEASDAIGWVHCHVARRPPPPETVSPSVPGVLSEIILKLLAKVPDERYQSAAGLAYDLERCLERKRDGRIAPFSIGEHDISDRFLIPQKLYGRAAEVAVLQDLFERVAATGTPVLALVSGPSGIGKSAVVDELHRPVVARRGLFVRGKFEQYKRDIPYLTVVQAFREIILDILAESADSIAAWRRLLLAAVAENGRLVVDLIPEVGLILGAQPPVPELSLSEAENRLRRVLREFLAAFASEEHPLAMFLDDLQWADPASLNLIVDLVTHPSLRHLIVVGAYRDNEVGPAHPLARAIEEARASGAAIRTLVLGPLPEGHVSELVADTVHSPRWEVESLARLVRDKTGGNPFFVIQFLAALHRRGLISFDRGAHRWRWDLGRIRAEEYTDNVVELMVSKLHGLPAETQEALKLAACLGARMDVETLAVVFERSPELALRAAIEDDLLLQVENAYRFPHDRVQEAAYSLVPESERARVHLAIGRLLLAHTAPADVDEKIFDIVNQLDRGAAFIASGAERERVAELNLKAGVRAQRSAAYATALKYFATGAEILADGGRPQDDSWDRRHDLAFALELHRAECELVTRDLGAAEARLTALTGRAASTVEAAAVASLQADLYNTSGRSQQAVEACLAYLRRVGIAWSAHPTREEVREEYAEMWRRLGNRSIESLADLPPMTDPAWRATMDVFMMFTAPASFTDENLCCLAVARAANLTLEHGDSDGSPQAYVLLGEILGTNFDNYDAAARFGKLGFDLMDKRGPFRHKAAVYFCFAQMVNPWIKHFRSSIELQRRAFEAAEQTGNLQTGSFTRNGTVTLLIAAGEPLREVERVAEEGLAFARRARFDLVANVITAQLRLVRLLRGLTPRFSSFDGDDFEEAAFEQRMSHPAFALSAGWYWIRKLQGRFFALDYAAALEAATRAESLLWTARAFPETAEYHFYAGLAHAAAYDAAAEEDRLGHIEALAGHHRQLEVWARSCPDNFASRAALIGAECARLRTEPELAERLYEEAIASARDSGFVHNEALAFETAARFYRGRGQALIADTYLREARDRYLRWGADGKARDLEQQHPQIVEPRQLGASMTVALQAEQLDLLSVVKASQTISGVMIRVELLRTLLRLVLEAGGARRAVVLLAGADHLEIAAEVRSEEAAVPATAPAGATAEGPLPDALLAYVQRTGERVLLDDAAHDVGRFSGDPYLRRIRPRSVLCLPVRRQAETLALLYLENDLVPGAFTPERLLALELLAAQAAISLENALLLERERAGRVEAEEAERRANLLGEATALMTSTLDYEGVFEAVTRLCVRSFADWAVIDLLEGERIVRLAGAHRDPKQEPFLHELTELYPANARAGMPAAQVLKNGEPLLLPDIDLEYLRNHTVSEHHAELVERLGARSLIVVPLVARDTNLGALTLVSATPQRFGPADVEVASEIGRRAALAVDNARLLRETQRAVRLRDDFLSVASHELRTPLTSLTLTVKRLLEMRTTDQRAPPEALYGGLDRVNRSAQRLRRLTEELLDVTRIEQGRLDLKLMPTDLCALARRVVDELTFELAAAGCRTRFDAPAEPIVGLWDPSRVEQVIANLITNALKFGAGRPIDIRLYRAGHAAELSVRDQGVGISPDRQPFVFDRFERAVSTTNYGGLGLGLYIARRIVQAHGGDLRVKSEPDHGATFTLTLPLGPTPAH